MISLRILSHLSKGHFVVVLSDDGVCYFPDLKQVIFSGTAYQPWIIQVPAKIGQVIGVATMHEESLLRVSLS